jgi:diphthamide biosynthesis protein 4
MSYTKNYYAILGLDTTSLSPAISNIHIYTQSEIRAHYKKALFKAHPDTTPHPSHMSHPKPNPKSKLGGDAWTVDDVKEAYMILGDEGRKKEYDIWLKESGWKNLHSDNQSAQEDGVNREAKWTEDFILGLEILDLSDFTMQGTTESDTSIQVEHMAWTRPCRCGMSTGYTIEEKELEGAMERGEKVVLVGCRGCSLWVRVGFEVEEG